jgi:hypothetical protein
VIFENLLRKLIILIIVWKEWWVLYRKSYVHLW